MSPSELLSVAHPKTHLSVRFGSVLFLSHHLLLFLSFVLHVQFCTAKSRGDLSQLLHLLRSFNVSFCSQLRYRHPRFSSSPLLSSPLSSSPLHLLSSPPPLL